MSRTYLTDADDTTDADTHATSGEDDGDTAARAADAMTALRDQSTSPPAASGPGIGTPHLPADLSDQQRIAQTLRRQLAAEPATLTLAHDLGLFCYWSAQQAPTRHAEHAFWLDVIASWAMVLESDAYWLGWANESAQRYGEPIGKDARIAAQQEVNELLVRALTDADQRTPERTPGVSLEQAYRLEVTAIQLLQQASGYLGAHRVGAQISYGPLAARQFNTTDAVGRFFHEDIERGDAPLAAASLRQPSRDRTDSAGSESWDRRSARHLRLCYSQLGLALMQLRQGQAERALALLAAAPCDACADAASRMTAAPAEASPPPVCVGTCAQFAERNPAYAFLDRRGARLAGDAAMLAAEARLALAERDALAESLNGAEVEAHWRGALALTSAADDVQEVRDAIVATALGRVAALEQRERLDAAVQLLEAAVACTEHARLTSKLTETLAHRGVVAGNADRWDDAVTDLRRALTLNSHVGHTRSNLVTALRSAAALQREAGDTARSRALLDEAFQALEDGLASDPHNSEWRKWRLDTRVELASVARPASAADDASASADEDGAAAMLHRCLDATGLAYERDIHGRYVVHFRTRERGRLPIAIDVSGESIVVVTSILLGPGQIGAALYPLLRATALVDTHKVGLTPNGDLRLLAETPAATVTASILDGLIQDVVRILDVPDETLCSAEALSASVGAVRAARLRGGRQARLPGPDAPEAGPNARAAHPIQAYSSQRGLACEMIAPDRFQLTIGPVRADALVGAPGTEVTLVARCTDLRPSRGNLSYYRRLAQVNLRMDIGRYTLDSDDVVVFSYHLPCLDDSAFAQLCERTEAYVSRYGRELGALS